MEEKDEIVGFEVLSPDENGIIDVYRNSIPEEDKPIKVKVDKPVKKENPQTGRIIKGLIKTLAWLIATIYCINDCINMAHGGSLLIRFMNGTDTDALIVLMI